MSNMEKERNYVVPHDFSEAADNALKQAVEIAKPTSSKVYILHIVNKESEVNIAQEKLDQIIDKSSYRNLEKSIKRGSIFNAIGEFAEEKRHLLLLWVLMEQKECKNYLEVLL